MPYADSRAVHDGRQGGRGGAGRLLVSLFVAVVGLALSHGALSQTPEGAVAESQKLIGSATADVQAVWMALPAAAALEGPPTINLAEPCARITSFPQAQVCLRTVPQKVAAARSASAGAAQGQAPPAPARKEPPSQRLQAQIDMLEQELRTLIARLDGELTDAERARIERQVERLGLRMNVINELMRQLYVLQDNISRVFADLASAAIGSVR